MGRKYVKSDKEEFVERMLKLKQKEDEEKLEQERKHL
jgi:hypothetical protein